jgi:hypothetical protein
MAYVVRTKDSPGDVGRAADQQQSVDNEVALYTAILGEGPLATGGMVRQFVKLTGIADATATQFCTITTANEAGDTDGGVFSAFFEGMATHGYANDSDDTSCIVMHLNFSRALEMHGTPGTLTAVNSVASPAVAASNAANKTITTAVVTVAETSEYITSVLVNINCAGGVVTTGDIFGMMTLYYAGFLTPPVITSSG